jgi:hypothetical protein
MITSALLVVIALVGLVVTAYGAIRLEQGRRRRDEEARWAELAVLLDAELRVGEDGRPWIRGRAGDVEWDLRQSAGRGSVPRFGVRFEGADRLAPAAVWRSSHEDEEEDGRPALGTDFKLVFAIDESPVPAGCVRWLDDPEIQDLLMTIHPLAARVVETRGMPPVPTIEIALEDARRAELTVLTIRASIDWALRMAHLAREGRAAAPPH